MAIFNMTKKISTVHCGNGLAAIRDIPAESILIRVPNPYILLPDRSSLSRICSWCFHPVSSSDLLPNTKCITALKKCSACKVSQYCSTACQRADWKAIHAKECGRLANLPSVPPTPVRAAMRVLLGQGHGLTWDPLWAELKGHEEEMKTQSEENHRGNWGDILLQARAVMTFSGFAGPAYMELATAILCRVSR